MDVASCPYCGSDRFSNDVVRADAPDTANPARHGQVYGHWFNKCFECKKWSVHEDGKQLPLKARTKKPKKHSRAAVA